jgi:hypothetical protein
MLIGIIGSSGYLGGALLRSLSKKGYQVKEVNFQFFHEIYPFSKPMDLLIDCGFPRNIHRKKISTSYLSQLEQQLFMSKKNGIKYVYVGSLSEDIESNSAYGRVKASSTNLVKKYGGCVIRTGLVVDNKKPGGRYKELLKVHNRMPIKIIPNERFFPIGVTFLEDFLDTANEIVKESDSFEAEVLCKIQWITMKKLLQTFTNSFEIHLSFGTTKILCVLINFLPLGKFDNLKSIAKQKTR